MPRLLVGVLLAAQLAHADRGTLCSDDCRYRHDGECDDSGPNSESSTCALGSDCRDCGPRKEADLGTFICDDKCKTARDGQCDDGGPGSQFKTCGFGSDCADCGKRATGARCGADGRLALCGSGCMFASDGHCDDGGPGSKFDSCSRGSDCADCGSREQSCGSDEDEEESYDDMPLEASPPPPRECSGDGRPQCNMKVCSIRMAMDMCGRCECSTCSFCAAPKGVQEAFGRATKSPPPPLPARPPPWEFTCDLLQGRTNVRFANPPHWCYTLPMSECAKSFTYDWHSSGKADLSICHLVKNKCEPMYVAEERYSNNLCRTTLLRLPPASPHAPPHPVQSPPPPSPPPPAPCIPLSGKCGGQGPQRSWQCCQSGEMGAVARCFKKDEEHSQCRLECVDGWACDTKAKVAASNVPSRPWGGSTLSRTPKVSSPSPAPVHSPPVSSATVKEEVHAVIKAPHTDRNSLVPDACKSCRVVDPSGVGSAWRAVSSQFGNGCYTLAAAAAVFDSNGGTWPGIADFSSAQLPPAMIQNPSRCYQLPEGFECFKSPGRSCSAKEKPPPTGFGEEPRDVLSVHTPFLSFSTHLPPSVLALGGGAVMLLCILVACRRLSRDRGSRVGLEKIPVEEPGDCDGIDLDDPQLREEDQQRMMMARQVVNL